MPRVVIKRRAWALCTPCQTRDLNWSQVAIPENHVFHVALEHRVVTPVGSAHKPVLSPLAHKRRPDKRRVLLLPVHVEVDSAIRRMRERYVRPVGDGKLLKVDGLIHGVPPTEHMILDARALEGDDDVVVAGVLTPINEAVPRKAVSVTPYPSDCTEAGEYGRLPGFGVVADSNIGHVDAHSRLVRSPTAVEVDGVVIAWVLNALAGDILDANESVELEQLLVVTASIGFDSI